MVLILIDSLLESGGGQYKDSPNGVYQAQIFDLCRGGIILDKRNFIRYSVKEIKTEKIIALGELNIKDKIPPDFRRENNSIQWDNDTNIVKFSSGDFIFQFPIK